MRKSSWLLLPIFIIFGFLVGCEDEDLNKLAKAQKCLNEATTAGGAAACESHVSGMDSTDAWIIRCSARMLGGGLDESTMVAAYDAADAVPEDEFEATLMTGLALSSTASAASAFDACQQTQVDGLIYLSGIVNVGTQITSAVGNAGDADDLVDFCQAAPGNCDRAEIGDVALALEETYCNGGNEDSEVCVAINSAVANAAPLYDPATIGDNLFNLIDPDPGS